MRAKREAEERRKDFEKGINKLIGITFKSEAGFEEHPLKVFNLLEGMHYSNTHVEINIELPWVAFMQTLRKRGQTSWENGASVMPCHALDIILDLGTTWLVTEARGNNSRQRQHGIGKDLWAPLSQVLRSGNPIKHRTS